VRKKRLRDASTGEGARLGGGRWNHIGTPVIYVSESLSLAALETFVHFTRRDIKLSRSLYSVYFEIPDSLKIEKLSIEKLPHEWRTSPPIDSTKAIGTKWVRELSSAVLKVPSAIIPEEYNFVLNPKHKDFDKIKIGEPQIFMFDERMWTTKA
jgi:RES domain-containing protein